MRRRHGTRGWESLTWPNTKTSGVSVGPSGRWVYVACGNGVLVSEDGGQQFRLTGGWEMTEVQSVCIDRTDPTRAWAATAYGVFRTRDITASRPWRATRHEGQFRYCSSVLQDPQSPDQVWVAAEDGLFRSEHGGDTYRCVMGDVPVRALLADAGDTGQMWAGTDGKGLWTTRNGGTDWQPVPGAPGVVLSLAQGLASPGVLYCGSTDGVHVTRDGGRTWARAALADGAYVYSLACHPHDPQQVLAAGNDGLWRSADAGATWSRHAFDGTAVSDIAYARLAQMPPTDWSTNTGTLHIPGRGRRLPDLRPLRDPGFDQRARAILETASRNRHLHEGRWPDLIRSIWIVQEGQTDAAFWARVRTTLADPDSGGPSLHEVGTHYNLSLVAFFLHCRESLPPDIAARISGLLTRRHFYRGDTENHYVMHYTSQLLAAQTWPETPVADWYTHRSSQEVYDEARGWLLHWARLTAAQGQGEFDSPAYINAFVTSMLCLYDFAEDAEIRQMAGMMLDLLLADYFAESLAGAYTGAHSRDKTPFVAWGARNLCAIYHYLYAGGIELPDAEPLLDWACAAVYSTYRPPPVLSAIANRRDAAYEQIEGKRVRNVIRFGAELNPPVHKYTYMTSLYAMGSMPGGILQPIQQHTWDVNWRGSGWNPVLFTLHPYYSAMELGMFFPEDMHALVKLVVAQKAGFSSPDKWVSSSPFERIWQKENVLVALYRVPPGERHQHVQLYWPACLSRTEREGWFFGRDGDFYVAVAATRPGTWSELGHHWRFRCPADEAAFAVVTRPAASIADQGYSFNAFQEEVLRLGAPHLDSSGSLSTFSFPARHVQGAASWPAPEAWRVDWSRRASPPHEGYPTTALFRGPFLASERGSLSITMTDGQIARTLDFGRMTVREAAR